MNANPTKYTIEALTETYDFRPYGDGYAPQIVLTASRGRLENVTELNAKYLPFTAEEFKDFATEMTERFYLKDLDIVEVICRYMKMYYGMEVTSRPTSGYSQGDWGVSFLFFPEEWQETVGWSGDQTAKDESHNDLCAWIWGDVYEVCTKEVTHTETCSLGHDHIITDEESEHDHFIYGMDEANKFANENDIEIVGL